MKIVNFNKKSASIEKRESPIKSKIESLFKLAFTIGACIGGCVVFGYSIKIHFFPSGLKIGESLFFIFVAAAFSLIYGLIILLSTFSAIAPLKLLTWLYKNLKRGEFSQIKIDRKKFSKKKTIEKFIFRKLFEFNRTIFYHRIKFYKNFFFDIKAEKKVSTIDSILLSFLSLIFLLILILISSKLNRLGIALNFLTMGIGILFFLDLPKPIQTRKNKKPLNVPLFKALIIFTFSILPLFFNLNTTGEILNITMKSLGIRAENRIVRVEAKDFESIKSAADQLDIPIGNCKYGEGAKNLIFGADILFDGIGEKSLIQLTSHVKKNEQGDPSVLRATLPSKDIRIIETHPDIDGCISVQTDALFDIGKATPKKNSKREIDQLFEELGKYPELATIKISGYTDHIGEDKFDNQQLSQERASGVKYLIQSNRKYADVPIETKGYGATRPIKECPDSLSGKEEIRCLAPNRRVTVEVKIK